MHIRRAMLRENYRRARIFAFVVIAIESSLMMINLASAQQQIEARFQHVLYSGMYSFMIVITSGLLIATYRFRRLVTVTDAQVIRFERLLHSYALLFTVWGSILTLFDQALYGGIIVFIINLLAMSTLFYFSTAYMIVNYTISVATLFVLLPFYQPDFNRLVGHYLNLSISLVFLFVASRILYGTFVQATEANRLLHTTNERLQDEIEENRIISEQLQQKHDELQHLVLYDELTQIPNRRAFYRFIERHRPLPTPISLMVIDVDAFKKYNDHYGHLAGDLVLKDVAQQLNDSVTTADTIVARMGGEEFVIAIFGETTHHISTTAEQVRQHIERLHLPHEYNPFGAYVTVSIGTTTTTFTHPTDIVDVIRQADDALYVAKHNGRNQVAFRSSFSSI